MGIPLAKSVHFPLKQHNSSVAWGW